MANPWTGEITVQIDGVPHVLKLTLGALAELEAELGTTSLTELVTRFETGDFLSADVLALLKAGLRGGGWQGTSADLLTADFQGGLPGAARAAARLLAVAFALPEQTEAVAS